MHASLSDEHQKLVIISAPENERDAVSVLLSTFSDDVPAPILLILPGSTGIREELGKHTALRLSTLESGETELRPGSIYLVPDGHSVDIRPRAATLHSRRGRQESIQRRVIHSAAEAYGEELVAIFIGDLSPDAAQGVYEISALGGTVLAQGRGPRTLPSWLPPNRVDIVAPLEHIARAATDVLRGDSYLRGPDEEQAFRNVLDALREQFGIDFSTYKRPTISRRLARRMAETAQTSVLDYMAYLGAHPEEGRRLLSSFLIKVTEFFRDPQLFEYLRDHILPQMIEEARHGDRELRIWSAGCATGEEAYSLAVLVAELLGPELDDFRVRIFATDLDEEAIEFARHGIYPPAAVASLSPETVERYFIETDGGYQIKKRVRSLCVFGVHDLGERAPFPRIDVLVCRNVLIYFTTNAQRRVLQLFAFSLRTGGYLVLGKSETPSPLSEYFVADNGRLKVYRRRGDRMLIPPARIRETSPAVPFRHTSGQPRADSEVPRIPRDLRRSVYSERAEDIVNRLPIGIVTVDARYDIHTINGAARRMLRIHGTAVGEDFIHQAQDIPSRALRSALDTALGGSEAVLHDVPIVEPSSGLARYVRLSAMPDGASESAPVESALLLVEDVTASVEERQRIARDLEQRQQETAELELQLERLTLANQELLVANEELTVQNMELSSANEEFLVGNEELQAAAEEVETLNEELQATNEELETLNEQLQSTVEELNTTNEDLQARSVELQELAVSLAAQRASIDMQRGRLEAILASMADGVLVVDQDGTPILTNAAYEAMFPPDGSVRILDGNGKPVPEDETPQARARRGETFSREFSVSVDGNRETRFEANGRPVQDSGRQAGGVVVIRDISDRGASAP